MVIIVAVVTTNSNYMVVYCNCFDNDMVVYCLLLVTITVETSMVIIAAFVTTNNNYDQLLVNKPPTNQQTRNCLVNVILFIVMVNVIAVLVMVNVMVTVTVFVNIIVVIVMVNVIAAIINVCRPCHCHYCCY